MSIHPYNPASKIIAPRIAKRRTLSKVILTLLSVVSFIGLLGALFISAPMLFGVPDPLGSVSALGTVQEIKFSGVKLLDEAQIRSALPLEESIWYWHTKRPLIEAGLLNNSRIAKARIERCSSFSVRCFNVEITEREPSFFTVIGYKAWLVGDDGGIIKPVKLEKITEYLKNGEMSESSKLGALALKLRIPVVSNLLQNGDSADMVKAKFRRIKAALDVIQDGTGLWVNYIEAAGNKEVRVRFFGYGFEARVDISEKDLLDEDAVLLKDKVARLKRILDEYGEKKHFIQTIDLAYDKIAVVKTN